MRHVRAAFLLLVIFFSVSYVKAQDYFPVIEKAILLLSKEPTKNLKMDLGYKKDESQSASLSLNYTFQQKNASLEAKAHGNFNQMQLDLAGEMKYIANALYFILRQSPVGRREVIGEWFKLDLAPWLPTDENKTEREVETMLKSLSADYPAIRKAVSIKELASQRMNKIVMRHFSVGVNLKAMISIVLSKMPKEAQEKGGILEQWVANFQPIPVDLWIGKTDGKLYRAKCNVMKLFTLDEQLNYHPKISKSAFRVPLDPIDARALDLSSLEVNPDLLPPVPPAAQKPVKPLPNTTISLVALSPYRGPSLETLKAFLETQYGLQNVTIMPTMPISEDAFITEKRQYEAATLLKGVLGSLQGYDDNPNHFLIVLTDQSMTSSQYEDPDFYSSLFGEKNHAVLSFAYLKTYSDAYPFRAEKLLARTLGTLYWKFPYTTLPQDVMVEPLHPLVKGLDRMGFNFLIDESLPYLTEAEDDEKAGKLEDAEKAYEAAIRLNPENPEAYFSLGKIKLALKEPKEAALLLNKSLLLAPTEDETYELLGQAYEALNENPDAISEYRAAIFLNPKNTDARNHLSALFEKAGNLTRAKFYRQDTH